MKKPFFRLRPTLVGRQPAWVLQERSLGFWGNYRVDNAEMLFIGEEVPYEAEQILRHLNKQNQY